ncbi:Ni/Fe hydrogenase subunit alpha [Desulfopila inferna]|uniref:Ni/Fe hydrogenase subunit alpha n=1 Tax=Desulfopila inferna TaxID=468528 RepID=UPI0019622E69|nr:Ni/Fe hydrogenase subunit alpha [Desulfopila inferna]MBM9604817.1 Ni/Fe hydrogenase subunit alpha [Desulfopila inferna]
MSKTIKIDPVTRIEGHARIVLECDDSGTVTEASFCVNELRGFERILVGMEASTMPQVTARICGVCPTAHHLVAAKALDNAAGVEIPAAAKLLREFMYMGHYIHSHSLSLFVLAGPDLVFGLDGDPATRNIVGMVEANPELSRKGLRLRSLGQKINETIGGRGIHPVTAVAGGISFSLSDGQFKRLQELTAESVQRVHELAGQVKKLLFNLLDKNPVLLEKLNSESWYLGTVQGGRLNFYDGMLRAMDTQGGLKEDFSSLCYKEMMSERAVQNSYAKEVYLNMDGAEQMYRVGPLARLNVADSMETPLAQKEFEVFREKFGKPCHNAVLQMYAKLIELVYACEKSHEIINNPALRGETRVPADFRGGTGIAHIEAPRGTLIHEYDIDDRGIVRSANMIIATQQNTAAINASLREGANSMLQESDDEAMLNGLEFVVRCYDPCLACSTHAIGKMALDVELVQNGRIVRKLRRKDNA